MEFIQMSTTAFICTNCLLCKNIIISVLDAEHYSKKQERPRAPVVKLPCLQEHVHKKKVLETVSHHSRYNIFKARNSCIVPGGFSMPLVVLSIGTHVTLAKLYKLADPHMHVKSPGNSRRSRKRYEDISNKFMFDLQISRIWFLQLYYTANH